MSHQRSGLIALATLCALTCASTALAQDTPATPATPAAPAATTTAKSATTAVKSATDDVKTGEVKADAKKKVDKAADKQVEKLKEKKAKKSANGDYEWKLNYGGGAEFGLFFTELGRFNGQLLEPNGVKQFDTDVALNIDVALEISPIEGARFTLFGGVQGPFTDDPSILAMYIGFEPAFAFRQGSWELALGLGAGVGALDLNLESGQTLSSGLVLMRPFIEARSYASEWMAAFVRVGFNYWHVYDVETSGLTFDNTVGALDDANLDEGGLYLSVGLRFGHYPDPIKIVEDSDNDTILDDIDECPDEPEDMDGFEDADGCPENDNDKDGVFDEVDKCPNEAEDKDGWMDEDGCPESDDDVDKDGLFGEQDKCPTEAEDKDGFEDTDGCPDPDNDKDGVLDGQDKCPIEAEDKDGFEDTDGCPDPDNDRDTVLDAQDKCPDVFGLVARQGCPIPDKDGDGIEDDKDKCPDEPETFNGNKDEDGCPDGKQIVIITRNQIKITEKVLFDINKATIKSKSFPLLDTVANVMLKNPKLTKIRVEGHTDDVGSDSSNLELSKRRAKSVREYLIAKGIKSSRLSSEGYGETRPLCKDVPELLKNKRKNRRKIKGCRATNRRVIMEVMEVNGRNVSSANGRVKIQTKTEKVD